GNARGLGKRTVSILLHHPQIGARRTHDTECILDHAAIDATHRHHGGEQKADTDRGQNETAQAVLDVTDGEVHGCDFSAASASDSAWTTATRRPSFLRSASRPGAVITLSPPEKPSITSIQPA